MPQMGKDVGWLISWSILVIFRRGLIQSEIYGRETLVLRGDEASRDMLMINYG